MTLWLTAAVVVLGAVAVVLAVRLLALRRRVAELEARGSRGIGPTRELQRLQRNQELLTRLLASLPQYAGRLYGEESVRKVPGAMLEIARQLFQAEDGVVLLRRKASSVEPDRDRQLVVAAAVEGSAAEVGSVILIGEGELGVVAARCQVMDRDDLDRAAGARPEAGPGRFRADLAAPILLDGEVMGVLAVARPLERRADDKLALRVVAQLGALALSHRAELSRVRSVADLDALTGILNKGVLNYRLSELIYQAERQGADLAIFLFDIDHFKSYNERNGHLAGDALLRELARAVEEEVRSEDLFGRYGGEEFLLILPGRDLDQGAAAAEMIRRRIERHPFAHADGQPLGGITVSGGVAAFPEHGLSSSQILEAASLALDAAKGAGRNRLARAAVAGRGGLARERPIQDRRIEQAPALEGRREGRDGS
ncbi:MAG: sensor domain-containing diguanylate cyclase [Thermoanaerobaculia bacterium]|nr:sensor domain-containing diguanylate cyclase [Thermoanaerobaculia bacterium]